MPVESTAKYTEKKCCEFTYHHNVWSVNLYRRGYNRIEELETETAAVRQV